jgi:hypothetical protein
VIGYRHCDARYPFLWEDSSQPPARWHGDGEGPAHYFADSPDGAWAEFVRHEEITDAAELAGIRRALWAVVIEDPSLAIPALPLPVLRGDRATYPSCRTEARALRAAGATGLRAPSAALKPGEGAGWHTDDGLRRAAERDADVIVLFGRRPDLEGWMVATEARPPVRLLDQVAHFVS